MGGGLCPPYKYVTKCTSQLRVFDNLNSKAKTLATLSFAKIKSAKFKVARFLKGAIEAVRIVPDNEDTLPGCRVGIFCRITIVGRMLEATNHLAFNVNSQ